MSKTLLTIFLLISSSMTLKTKKQETTGVKYTVSPDGTVTDEYGNVIKLAIGLDANGMYNYWYSKDEDMYKGRSLGDTLTCSEATCPRPNECIAAYNFCMCDKSMANYPFIGHNNQFCTYKRKRQVVAFLWELFTNVGVGHYYIHQIVRGVFKTLMTGTPLVIFTLGKLRLLKYWFNEGTTGIVMACIMCACGLGAFIWWLVDAFMFGLNKYRDFNGVPLKHW